MDRTATEGNQVTHGQLRTFGLALKTLRLPWTQGPPSLDFRPDVSEEVRLNTVRKNANRGRGVRTRATGLV